MFDVKRIRERAADWLIDVGYSTLLRLGDAAEIVRGEPHEEAIERGDETDDELRARVKATLARGEPCPGHHVDFEPCDLCASPPEPAAPRIEVRDGVEWLVGAGRGALPFCGETAAPIGGYPVSCTAHLHGQHIAAGYDHGNGARVYHRWPIEPSAGTSTPAGQDPAPHPPGEVQGVDGDAPPDTRTPEEREASRARIKAWLARPEIRAFAEELDRPMQAFLAWHRSPRWQRLIEQGGDAPRDVARGAFLAGWRARDEHGRKPGADRPEPNDSELLGSKMAPASITPPGDASGPPVEKASPAPADAESTQPVKGVPPMGEDGGQGVDGARCMPVLLTAQERASENGVYCAAHGRRFSDCEEPAVKPPHNGEQGALGEAHAVGVCSRPRCPEGEKLRAIGRYCPCGAELRPVGIVSPPDPFVIITPEALGYAPPEAKRKPITLADLGLTAADMPRPPPGPWRDLVESARDEASDGQGLDAMIGDRIVSVRPSMSANLCAIAAEATRATDGAAPALAADVEEQRLSHGGCTRLPPEMLAALGVKDGDMVWFLRSQPGGRWEAWTSAELDAQLGMGEPSEARAAVDAMPFHVASRLTAGEARRLEASGWTAGVVWYHDDPAGARHEVDALGLDLLRCEAGGSDDPVPADAPPLECQIHPTELDASCALCAFPVERTTPPVVSAAERVPESPTGGAGAPWRGLNCEVVRGESIGCWVVIANRTAPEGVYRMTVDFHGQHAEARAREYAALMSARAGAGDTGQDPEIVALRERGFTLSPDLEDRASAVLRSIGDAPAVHEERPVVDTRWGAALEREAKASESYRDPVAQRDAAILRAAAKLVRTEEDARLILEALGWINPDAVERVLFGEDEDGEGDAEPAAPVAWTLQGTEAARAVLVDTTTPALPKPDVVSVGQLWRSKGIAHVATVATVDSGIVQVDFENGSDGTIPESSMLRSASWTYLGMVKPSRVEAGQRWRCVGVDGELVVARIDSGWDGPERAAFIGGNLGSARTADMLGLREWSYVGGAR